MVEINGELIPLGAFLSNYLILLLYFTLFLLWLLQSSDLLGFFTSPY